jgi:Peptidase propeptide and YPEB domain
MQVSIRIVARLAGKVHTFCAPGAPIRHLKPALSLAVYYQCSPDANPGVGVTVKSSHMKTISSIALPFAIFAFAMYVPLANAATVSQDALKAEAKVTEADARTTALAKVPNGTVKNTTLEKEHGKLVWSFDIVQSTTKDLTEIQVDATTGMIAAVTKESPAQEAKEAKHHDKSVK